MNNNNATLYLVYSGSRNQWHGLHFVFCLATAEWTEGRHYQSLSGLKVCQYWKPVLVKIFPFKLHTVFTLQHFKPDSQSYKRYLDPPPAPLLSWYTQDWESRKFLSNRTVLIQSYIQQHGHYHKYTQDWETRYLFLKYILLQHFNPCCRSYSNNHEFLHFRYDHQQWSPTSSKYRFVTWFTKVFKILT